MMDDFGKRFRLLVAAILVSGAAAHGSLLWEIGRPDDKAGELALGPDRYTQYSADGFYAVGLSNASKDWPYVHPGPGDGWAGSRAHTFTVLFALDEPPSEGECELRVDLVDTHGGSPPQLRIGVNGHGFDYVTPQGGASQSSIHGRASEGRECRFDIAFPSSMLKAGENEITITNRAGSWMVYDWIGLDTPETARLAKGDTAMTHLTAATSLPLLVEKEGALRQLVRVAVSHFGEPRSTVVRVYAPSAADASGGAAMASIAATLEAGAQTLDVPVPAVEQETPVTVRMEADGQVLAAQEVTLKPVRKWVVYLLHHTHLDIGYTHVQTEVEQIQWRHIDKALELARRTADYPVEARFKWLPEGLWAVDSYLRNASQDKRDAFIEAVKQGVIGLDALYGNELTALCRPEELLELSGYARRLARQYGFTIDSAMITDVPGYTWGVVPALAQAGVKYFSIGPNFGFRIGYTLEAWGDRPFYWVSPSGEERLLFWMAAKGYSWFHGDRLRNGSKLCEYLAELEGAKYPYDIVQVRYNIGGDNGPPDEGLSDFVKDWNSRYAYPKLVIATPSEMCRAFEARYGDTLPELRGDFTPYWEDGAASSARETGINRGAAERLVQAQTLWSMLEPGPYPDRDFQDAWRSVLLYDEHTWGAHNSISEPESDFVKQQWAIKAGFALDADRRTRELLNRALQPIRAAEASVEAVLVCNTCSWPRTDLVMLPSDWPLPGDVVKDHRGKRAPSQRLTTGALAFVAADVPALGTAQFTIHAGAAHTSGRAAAGAVQLSNDLLTVTLDESTGAITSLVSGDAELVDRSSGFGLNDFLYVTGRKPDDPQRNGPVVIRAVEQGPVVASLRIESGAPGCSQLVREVSLVSGMDRVDLVDTMDKKNVYEPEGIHLAFPFCVPGGVLRMDVPWAVVRPEVDQLAGACKNYFTVQRWVDVSNGRLGVTCATIDAPMIEIGRITCDAREVGWLKTSEPSTTWYSYVMNNYWETNYKASQEGVTAFRYALRPHGAYDQKDVQRFGIERSQPLIVVPVKAAAPVLSSLFRVTPPGVVATVCKPSDDGNAWIIRLFNSTDRPAKAKLRWGSRTPKEVHVADLSGTPGEKAPSSLEMPPYAIMTLRAELAHP